MPRRSRFRRLLGSSRRRAPKLGAVSGLWLLLTAALGLVTVLVQSVTMIVVTLISLVVAVVSLFAGQSVAVPASRPTGAKHSSPRGKTSARRSAVTAGTAPRKRPRCGARCRRSTKDPKTCDCSCRGTSHGSEAGRTFADSRAALKTPQARKLEKRHVKLKEDWHRG